jgi:hypothetical protein
MSHVHSESKIRCPIGLFEPQEVKIEALTTAVNAAPPDASAKVPYARNLLDEVGVLLACPNYDHSNRNCELCRSFSALRGQTANLIVTIWAGADAR